MVQAIRRVTAARGARPTPHVPRPASPVAARAPEEHRVVATALDRGVQDIQKTDPGYDPTRFAGYTGMMYRDVQRAWTVGDVASLRDRFTAELYGVLHARCERLRMAGRSNHLEQIEILGEITEAWQEHGRDYATAYIAGSMIDYTVDDANDGVVEGSRTIPRRVEEFWTFTRAAGLNFWMLSAIQTA